MAVPARKLNVERGKSRFRSWLRSLPDQIAANEEDGFPVIVEHGPSLPEHAQRLYATLGCLVRFVDDGAEWDEGLAWLIVQGMICDHPDTCGGPWGQPVCLPCIDYAKRFVWGVV